MPSDDILLMAHLMRRAGFGASYEELERRTAVGYEATVEELLIKRKIVFRDNENDASC